VKATATLARLGLAVLLAGAARLARRFGGSAAGWLSSTDLELRLRSGMELTIVDVRNPDEFAGPLGHIDGARNLPLNDLPARMGELADVRKRPVVLVCKTEKRSAKAAEMLRSAGFRDVQVLRGGMEQWQRERTAGEPILADR
jgi:rhodanese-related sulfurtransferase